VDASRDARRSSLSAGRGLTARSAPLLNSRHRTADEDGVRLFRLLTATAAVALLCASVAPWNAAAATRPNVLRWGGQSFARPQLLAAWLTEHGGSYTAWAGRHPRARAIVEHDQPGYSAPRLPELVTPVSSDSGARGAIIAVLLALAGVCFAAALLPTALAAGYLNGRLLVLARHRLLLVGVASAIGIGALVSAVAH
jgi:hypothetical protein